MQTSTQALIQRYYDYFNQRNLSAFLSLLDPEVVHDINQGETQIGIDAFTAFMGRMNDAYEEQITDLVIMTTADGTRAAAEFVVTGTYLKNEPGLPTARLQRYQLACGAFFSIANGKITRVTNYYNLQDWLQQVK